jgi:N-acetylglucosaminyldiphosphoundecaprenol N-acetyl-beta-D-mannosaminyltransferase
MRTRARHSLAPAPARIVAVRPPSARARLLDCELHRVTMTEALDRVALAIDSGTYCQHVAINAAKLVALHDDAGLRDLVNRCELVTADGQAVMWASRLLGEAVPARVTGIDLMQALFRRAEERGWRVYVLGARHEVLAAAIRQIHAKHPRLRIVGWRDGYFEPVEDRAVAESICATGAQLLFVAISSPRKEQFLCTYGRATGAQFAMGVGGAIDVVAGRRRRAPVLLQELGLEWLFRLLQEPHRLLRRYTTTNLRFVVLVLHELAARHAVPGGGVRALLHRPRDVRSRG